MNDQIDSCEEIEDVGLEKHEDEDQIMSSLTFRKSSKLKKKVKKTV